MVCFLCKGPGAFFEQTKHVRQWWPCSGCGGDGVKMLYGPPTIRSHAKDIDYTRRPEPPAQPDPAKGE